MKPIMTKIGGHRFVETHCHLDSLKNQTASEAVQSALNVGVDKIITISVNPDNLDKVCQISEEHSAVYTTQGIHPHDAQHFKELHLEQMKKNIAQFKKIKAIGEIGLDYHYNFSPAETQKKVFESQLNLAIELNLPIIIHSREADDEMISFLKSYGPSLKRKGVLHSFSSSLKLAEVALDLGFYLGFNGIITFKTADLVREALKLTPTSQLIFETDSPYLAPAPYRGKENSPEMIPLIAQKALTIRDEKNEFEFYEKVYQNSCALFSL